MSLLMHTAVLRDRYFTPISQVRKQKSKEVNPVAQIHRAYKYKSSFPRKIEVGSPTSESKTKTKPEALPPLKIPHENPVIFGTSSVWISHVFKGQIINK